MLREEKLEIAQNFIDGMNSLTVRFCPDGVNPDGTYKKKTGRYFRPDEIAEVKKIHDRVNQGMQTKKNENDENYSEFDGATKAKPLVTKAKEKLAPEFENEEDLNSIIDLYFDLKNKDKVGDKYKKVK